MNEIIKYDNINYNETEVPLEFSKTTKDIQRDINGDILETSNEEEKNCPLEAAFNSKHYEILETLLRDMTLQKALITDGSSEADDEVNNL